MRGKLGGSFLVAFGSIILAWIGWLTWYDMTTFGKDIYLIFFGSRTGEAFSLGIGMKVIYWFLIGLALLLLGLLIRRRSKATELLSAKQISLLRRQLEKEKEEKEIKVEQLEKEKEEKEKKVEPPVKPPEKEQEISGCLHHFGYLASRPKNAPIPEECLICPKLGDCMLTTVYADKQKEGKI